MHLNYIRNSVKVVVDAYNGTVDFYLMDSADPIAATYQRIFPGLFKPFAAMPAGLQKHIRYPEDLFLIQARVYQAYHMEAADVFYNREDLCRSEIVRVDIFQSNEHPRDAGPLHAGRGCPYQCSFCTIINVQGRKSRYRSADDVEHLVRLNWGQGILRRWVESKRPRHPRIEAAPVPTALLYALRDAFPCAN